MLYGGEKKTSSKIYFAGIPAALLIISALALPESTAAASYQTLSLCVNVLLPSLFPFFVLSGIIISSGAAEMAGRYFEFIMRPLFNLPGECAPVFLLGILCGYPIGAESAAALYQKGCCTADEAERLLAFCNNTSPAFIIGAVGTGMFGNKSTGLLLYICHILAAITVGILLSVPERKKPRLKAAGRERCKDSSRITLSAVISTNIKKSAATMVSIFGFVTFFSLLVNILKETGVILFLTNTLSSLAHVDEKIANGLLLGIIEMTTGVNALAGAGGGRIVAAAAVCGFAGISVFFQIISVTGDSGLRYKKFILGKTMQAVLAVVFTVLASALFPAACEVFSQNHSSVRLYGSFSDYLATSLFSCAAAALLIFVLCIKKQPAFKKRAAAQNSSKRSFE